MWWWWGWLEGGAVKQHALPVAAAVRTPGLTRALPFQRDNFTETPAPPASVVPTAVPSEL